MHICTYLFTIVCVCNTMYVHVCYTMYVHVCWTSFYHIAHFLRQKKRHSRCNDSSSKTVDETNCL